MEEQLILFDTAKLAKEKGFAQDLFNTSWYNRIGQHRGIVNLNEKGEEVTYRSSRASDKVLLVTKKQYEECCSHNYKSPTQSLLQKWLRDVHNIDVSPHVIRLDDELNVFIYYPTIITHKKGMSWENIWEGTYEEALEKGLQEGLKLLKQ